MRLSDAMILAEKTGRRLRHKSWLTWKTIEQMANKQIPTPQAISDLWEIEPRRIYSGNENRFRELFVPILRKYMDERKVMGAVDEICNAVFTEPPKARKTGYKRRKAA